MKPTSNRTQYPGEGRRILYRLLLLAVVVVYALIFVLDYLLQLHFTFFLLLSLFGFVILMLFYMLFHVKKDDDKALKEEAIKTEDPEIISPASVQSEESLFGDAVFVINSSTGLTGDCNEAAVILFDAVEKNQLIGIDLTSLFDDSWKQDERNQIKEGLKKPGKVNVHGIFKTLSNKIFEGRLQAVRINDASINVRILPVAGNETRREKIITENSERNMRD